MNILRGDEIVVVKVYFCILILEKYKYMYILMIVQNVRSCIVHMTLYNFFIPKKGCVHAGKRTTTSIEYFKDPRRIVDLLNGMVFHGRQVITEDNLLEKNPVLHNVYREKNKSCRYRKYTGSVCCSDVEESEISVHDSDTNTGALCNAGQTFARERN